MSIGSVHSLIQYQHYQSENYKKDQKDNLKKNLKRKAFFGISDELKYRLKQTPFLWQACTTKNPKKPNTQTSYPTVSKNNPKQNFKQNSTTEKGKTEVKTENDFQLPKTKKTVRPVMR